MTCWARGTTLRAIVAPSGTPMTHGDLASTRKNTAALRRTARSTSDSASTPVDPSAPDSGAGSADARAGSGRSADDEARDPDRRSFLAVTPASYTPPTVDRSSTERENTMDNPAETYERYMVPVLFAPSAERMVELARPRPGQRVLDVGCGTGIVARRAAARGGGHGHITGLDASPGMLAVARAAAGREQRSIEWREGRAEALPFSDGEFDLVLCQYALMFFTAPSAALAEM